MHDAINEFTLEQRAKESADYILKECTEFDKAKAQNTYDSWQEYFDSLDELELSDLAHTEADSWDWVIYNGKALELCANVYGSTLNEAESLYLDCATNPAGLYEMATGIAYWIIYQAVMSELESQLEDLRELATACQESTTK